MDYPKISMVIGSFNRLKLLELCIEAVRTELEGQSYEIIVVDGGSSDGSVEWLTAQKDIISIIQHNRGEWRGKQLVRKPWAYFMNLGFKCASGKYVCMLSGDSLIVPGAINNGVDLFDAQLEQGEKVAGVAFYFRDYPVRKKFAVAINLGNLYVNHGLYLRSAMEEVGYCDESYHFYFADTDLCLKLWAAGYKIIASDASFVEHYFEATPEIRASNTDQKKVEDRAKLIARWKGKAYPEDKEEYYRQHVGCWREHRQQPNFGNATIRRLVEVTSPDLADLPMISVLTVVYNDPEGLTRTIASVNEQTYPFVEYIVIDGASDEATQTVLKEQGAPIYVLVSEPDNGIYDAMNKGIAAASGDFCIFMNAGDTFYSRDTLQKTSRLLDGDVDVVYGHRNYIYGKNHETKKIQKSQPIEAITQGMPFFHQAIFYKAATLQKTPFNTTFRYAADYHQFVTMFKAGRKFKQVDEIICDFYAGGSSESGIRPYLECLKIQFDAFGDGDHMKDSRYMKGFIQNAPSFIEKYSGVPEKT
ncbi:PGL/p-HBAD biosynthesis glycosyltransferase/MT3031 [Roseovarius gaetbuli]|uniref:PGL/p-HBAD biosynthesis glycosyltransferase/MT3031 n=1 Tax=Roseovarius gaetbuli TaxID=1356575 RepID=A0A1X7A7N3_9RHOB|nr:glycosyltransferase [Roseovarius gaetbuli]SLN72511.1 PGL/p-HBAD biosynthesis glycosyltransferase/MT3031 [Roseovarius gaetbuli]